MPIYEYRCSKCGIDFELIRRMDEMSKPALCPQCGAEAEKLISVFAAQEGFYVRAPSKPAFRKPAKESDKTEGEK